MREFQFTITDPMGLHARPAGLLAKAVKPLDSLVTVTKKDGKSANAAKLMAVMTLAIKSGETVSVRIEGGNEVTNAVLVETFFRDNL